ncbi:hypothetical protein ACFW1A_40585 [Kitasatospora sp. NPDC058965]|uniref:hypothetical protein n=1 Tax=Kitasatospora sp. NPDC058965 TaxID=3346682 RepID=UPI0036942EFF
MTGLSWVPASCTLPTEQQPLRVAEWDRLFATCLTASTRPDRTRLHLVLAGRAGVGEWARDLADREGGCCSFFTFTVSTGPEVHLDVEVDARHEQVLDALQARLEGGRP